MTSLAYALARSELIRALTAYSGITTAEGLGDGTTLIDANLIGKDSQKIVEKTILIMSGDADWEDKGASAFDTGTGKITLQGTGFSAQIKAGTIFRILNISSVEIDVEAINTKIGTDADPAGTATLFAWLAKLFASGERSILGNYGVVTTYTDPTHFKVSGLAGFGDNYFKGFRVYVVRDAAGGGAAPQGEMQPISDYVSSDGTCTHTAFTVPLAVDDEVIILHPRLAEIASILEDTGTTLPATLATIAAYIDTEIAAIETKLDTPANFMADVSALALEATLGTHDTDIKALLAAIAGYIDTEVGAIETKLDTPANFMADLTTLETRLSAARALLLDEITALRMAELDAANIPANIDTLLTRVTAAVALASVCTEARLAELAAANIPADIDELKASKGRQLFTMDFWSDPVEEVPVGDAVAGATEALPSVTIADLPTNATIVRAIAMFKFRMIENINAGANKLNGATVANTSQVIQVADDTPGTYYDAINFVDDQFGLAAETREGGDILIGSIDISGAGKVDGNDGYLFRWLLARADLDFLNFNDVACGLRIWYSV